MYDVTAIMCTKRRQICLLFLFILPLAAQSSDAFQQAMSLVQQGKNAPAIELLEKLIANSPSDLKALNLLGIALAASGRRAEAGHRFEKALEISPNFVPALKNLAGNELALGK